MYWKNTKYLEKIVTIPEPFLKEADKEQDANDDENCEYYTYYIVYSI